MKLNVKPIEVDFELEDLAAGLLSSPLTEQARFWELALSNMTARSDPGELNFLNKALTDSAKAMLIRIANGI